MNVVVAIFSLLCVQHSVEDQRSLESSIRKVKVSTLVEKEEDLLYF